MVPRRKHAVGNRERARRSAGLRACRIAGFQTCEALGCATRVNIFRRADSEIGDTAALESCATQSRRSSVPAHFAGSLLRNALSVLLLFCGQLQAQTLDLPPRPTNAISGSEFAKSLIPLERLEREEEIYEQIALGNVPNFLRKLVPIHVENIRDSNTNSATYYVAPDYLAVGSDNDYFLTPLTPATAQRVANLLHCTLPTRKMVNDIYSAATVKLTPSPIPPSAAMVTVPAFVQHNSIVANQRKEQLVEHPLGALVAGDKKDVVISEKLQSAPAHVAIYGWHKPDDTPIQPLYTGHANTWADYSHGIRLVQLAMTVNGAANTVPRVLTDPSLCGLLSDEGPILKTEYPTTSQSESTVQSAAPDNYPIMKTVTLADFRPGEFKEKTLSYSIEPEIRVHINAPASIPADKPLKLIFFALPNGNTIEQTIGKQTQPGNDWHYDIQHIGAQTRFLRNALKDYNVVVAYMQAAQKSWPAWWKAHSNQPQLIPEIVASIKHIFKNDDVRVILSGHSGGGRFIFAYIDGVDQIPDDVERIAFLDSNYAYDKAQRHNQKLLQWLRASDQHYLSLLAYNDAVALLNGKTFVSAAGGTWGRSHAMLDDLGAQLNFTTQTNADLGLETYTALNGRLKFLLKENPEKKIYHTVQVERNGFIQSVLSGTSLEGNGYAYFGDRAYTNWIATK
jgi:hypothetical protein